MDIIPVFIFCSSGHNLDIDTYSLSLYGTLPYDDKTYIDGTLGISLLDMDHTRNHASGILTGSRDGKQIFGSIVYSAELEKNQLTVSPYGRLDGGYTILSSYSDSGTVAAIRYDEQKIKTGMISIGLLADDKIEIKNFKINRYGRLEYGKDISSSSNAVVSYVAVPNTKYSLNIDDEESNNIRAGFGADIETMSKWSYQLDYEMNHRLGSSHMDTLSAAAFYELELDTIISLSLDTEEFSHSAAKLEFDSRLTNGWFLNGAYEITDNQDLNYENTLNLQAVRYF
jgi:outer membrane autotransporter protein